MTPDQIGDEERKRAAAAEQLQIAADELSFWEQKRERARLGVQQAERHVAHWRDAVEKAKRAIAELTPVDDSKRELTDGSPVPQDGSHTALKPNGQQQGYVVLSPEERQKGYVRPYRETYVHRGRPVCGRWRGSLEGKEGHYDVCSMPPGHASEHWFSFYETESVQLRDKAKEHQLWGGCGSVTRMQRPIAETYARKPDFYGGTFCVHCGLHKPLVEFVWEDTDEQVGS